ncbi:ATP-dependent helicase [Clostridium polyendosporum]|uniref:DNA 5'-3' helicase n=1 Tax=Clostridium polyendosporum TaxID=69208 RepID=A0A919VFL7_9CLOT|nr:ATP-dependent DNA helicase [Clostridium polyendosporum]GIM28292.1 ATP-dependent helicase [Clostridium polyendosporum]
MIKKEVKVSVRNLVQFILRKGNIDNRFIGKSRAQEGIKAHQKLQKQNKNDYDNYEKEVYLKHVFSFDDLNIAVEGRADGIIVDNNDVIVEEIKSTNKELIHIDADYNPTHWAQVKFYAYIYSILNGLENISVQISYYQLTSNEIKTIRKLFSINELKLFVEDVLEGYYKWAKLSLSWINERNTSIKSTAFPFKEYRKGQRELAVSVYNTIREGGVLFAQAPTGIGKTISTIFPAVKAIGEESGDRIFYLTAKTITRTVAEEAFKRLRDKGLKFKTITLTAKDKICFNERIGCNPEQCQYALNYYDKVNNALFDVITNEQYFSREIIEQYSIKYNICPFEFSLDLSYWCDGIICDYNYVFDPRTYLKRFFDDINERYIFLVDEAHNLIDRGRDMFSAEILKSNILEGRKFVKGKVPKLYKSLNALNSFMVDVRRSGEEQDEKSYLLEGEPKDIYPLIRNFLKESDEYLVKNQNVEGYEHILELYFDLNAFVNMSEYYDEGYLSYVDCSNKDVALKLFCIYPRNNLQQGIKRAHSTIVFSATLTPLNYFIDILGGEEGSYKMKLSSPFNSENLCLMISPISTRYKRREQTFSIIVDYIYKFTQGKKGNYMIFFPSYAYMMKIYELFKYTYPNLNIIFQKGEMKEEERENFLNCFKENPVNTLIGFCVMGGIFSEGIDLTNDRLIGAVIIGVGLPQICFEREIIKQYFDEFKAAGYDYAYTFPGMNKVLQAAGRVIRTEEDRGAVLLIDDRFLTSKYISLMPEGWKNFSMVNTKENINQVLKYFWN